jgi:hypothetical protein
MKTILIRHITGFAILLAALPGLSQPLLLDSLKGTWELKEQYNNKQRVEPKGSIEFREDGTFKSHGSYFGSAVGLYRTDETKSTIHIEIDGRTTEWNASIRNHVLRMTKPRRKKAPRVDLVLQSEDAEENSSGSRGSRAFQESGNLK